jgi:hypothetical protein
MNSTVARHPGSFTVLVFLALAANFIFIDPLRLADFSTYPKAVKYPLYRSRQRRRCLLLHLTEQFVQPQTT